MFSVIHFVRRLVFFRHLMHSVSVNCMLLIWRHGVRLFCCSASHYGSSSNSTTYTFFQSVCYQFVFKNVARTIFKSRSIIITANSSINISGNYGCWRSRFDELLRKNKICWAATISSCRRRPPAFRGPSRMNLNILPGD